HSPDGGGQTEGGPRAPFRGAAGTNRRRLEAAQPVRRSDAGRQVVAGAGVALQRVSAARTVAAGGDVVEAARRVVCALRRVVRVGDVVGQRVHARNDRGRDARSTELVEAGRDSIAVVDGDTRVRVADG